MLSEDGIKKFQEIYKKEFSKKICKEEASEQGIKLVTLMKIILESNVKNTIDKD